MYLIGIVRYSRPQVSFRILLEAIVRPVTVIKRKLARRLIWSAWICNFRCGAIHLNDERGISRFLAFIVRIVKKYNCEITRIRNLNLLHRNAEIINFFYVYFLLKTSIVTSKWSRPPWRDIVIKKSTLWQNREKITIFYSDETRCWQFWLHGLSVNISIFSYFFVYGTLWKKALSNSISVENTQIPSRKLKCTCKISPCWNIQFQRTSHLKCKRGFFVLKMVHTSN
jgi:hypothetical protein